MCTAVSSRTGLLAWSHQENSPSVNSYGLSTPAYWHGNTYGCWNPMELMDGYHWGPRRILLPWMISRSGWRRSLGALKKWDIIQISLMFPTYLWWTTIGMFFLIIHNKYMNLPKSFSYLDNCNYHLTPFLATKTADYPEILWINDVIQTVIPIITISAKGFLLCRIMGLLFCNRRRYGGRDINKYALSYNVHLIIQC